MKNNGFRNVFCCNLKILFVILKTFEVPKLSYFKHKIIFLAENYSTTVINSNVYRYIILLLSYRYLVI